MSASVQRIRITFSRGESLKYLSHLDMMRLWERALRRAGLPLAYSEGFTPHARLSIAAPLPVGVTSDAELMDVHLERPLPLPTLSSAIKRQLPQGIKVLDAREVVPTLPSLQSLVRLAEYKVVVTAEKSLPETQLALRTLLALESLPWQHYRDTGPREYDLRPLIDDIWFIEWDEERGTLGMRLHIDSEGTGRPEQVTLALGFRERPLSIHRTKLILASAAPAPRGNPRFAPRPASSALRRGNGYGRGSA
ncbi:MAG: DUF2344 domain-containing protein [Chloroflexi bacterium]|nr:DUF2344 domain-containing protein [Chloroflexota bacterium]